MVENIPRPMKKSSVDTFCPTYGYFCCCNYLGKEEKPFEVTVSAHAGKRLCAFCCDVWDVGDNGKKSVQRMSRLNCEVGGIIENVFQNYGEH